MYILFLIISLLQIVLVLDYIEIVLKRRFLPLNALVQHLCDFQLSVCQYYKLFSCAGLREKENARETGCRNCLEDYACNLLQKRRKLPYFVEAIINLTI